MFSRTIQIPPGLVGTARVGGGLGAPVRAIRSRSIRRRRVVRAADSVPAQVDRLSPLIPFSRLGPLCLFGGLEGAARATLRLHPAQAGTVRAGQMLVAQSGARTLPNPIEIDLDRLMKTATLVTEFRPLPSLNLILAAIEDQNRAGAQLINPDFTPTGLDARDVVAAIRSQSTPSRPKSGKPPQDSRKP